MARDGKGYQLRDCLHAAIGCKMHMILIWFVLVGNVTFEIPIESKSTLSLVVLSGVEFLS